MVLVLIWNGFYLSSRHDGDVIKSILIARLLKQKIIYQYAEAAKVLQSRYGGLIEFKSLFFLMATITLSIKRRCKSMSR